MNRIDFTRKIAMLLVEMDRQGESPLLDYCKRSDEEQLRLYNAGKSKCDGHTVLSQHQIGKAADIYFTRDGKLVDPIKGFEYWHNVWDGWCGEDASPMIEWDKGHFECR